MKRILSVFLTCALLLTLLPTAALAAGETGDFTVTGGALDTDYSYADNTLTILTSKTLTISGTTTKDKIVIQDGITANVTLNNVNIDVISTNGACAFEVAGSAVYNLTLQGTNILSSGYQRAGLQVQTSDDKTASLTITEGSTGSLTATGDNGGAGIGGSYKSGGIIVINGGIIDTIGGGGAAGIGGGMNSGVKKITINGGNITARGRNLSSNGGAGIGSGYYNNCQRQ